ncbi:ThuA domain-containing protein [Horticoccus sp. 23ND18S-11]|uniref:ThuA domain-containing protein n=1 Tax=Horticoccus sp. 23ND18S-11 TaxID=3391832 RepID=UPI0039C8CB6A
MKFLSLLCLAATLAHAAPSYDQSGVPLEVDSPDPKLAKIILLASGPSSKAMAHEYFAGCALLMDWLKQQPGVWPVMARDWPKNPAVLAGAKCVVYFGDGGGKQPFMEPQRWAALTRLMDAGTGLVLLHQAMDFPKGPEGDRVKDWLGGVFRSDIGCRGHWDMTFSKIGEHPVTRGVKPFAAPGDGWLYNMHFAGTGVTPLLVGTVPEKSRSTADAKKHPGRDEVIAWAFERPGGGRGFSFTGADLHVSWTYESQRTLVLNGILWSAGLNVPAGGAKASFDPAALERNLDDKRKPAPKK